MTSRPVVFPALGQLACCAFVVTAAPRIAYAQEAALVTPMTIFDPESAEGLRIGQRLLIYPSVDTTADYDTNIYNVDDGKTQDVFIAIQPRVALRPDLTRHEFELSAGADLRRYFDTGEENSNQYNFAARGQLDLASRVSVAANAGFTHGIEQRGTAGDFALTDAPVAFNRKDAGVLIRRTGGTLELLGEAQFSETDYEDASLNGVPLDLSERDSATQRFRLRASAPTSHYTRGFVEISANHVSYEQDDWRNSSGFAIIGGLQVKVTNLIEAEAGLGYIHQEIDDPSFGNVDGLDYHLRLGWTPKPDWEITAFAGRSVDPSPQQDAPAIVRSNFRLEARKALSDRLLVTASANFTRESYAAADENDKRYFLRLGAHLRVTKNVALLVNTEWRHQDAGTFSRDFDGLQASAGVRVRL